MDVCRADGRRGSGVSSYSACDGVRRLAGGNYRRQYYRTGYNDDADGRYGCDWRIGGTAYPTVNVLSGGQATDL